MLILKHYIFFSVVKCNCSICIAKQYSAVIIPKNKFNLVTGHGNYNSFFRQNCFNLSDKASNVLIKRIGII